jgi:hypothetical protein
VSHTQILLPTQIFLPMSNKNLTRRDPSWKFSSADRKEEKGPYTTICFLASRGLRMNLRVRRVTGVSDMVAVERVESPAARICEREKEQKLDRDERVGLGGDCRSRCCRCRVSRNAIQFWLPFRCAVPAVGSARVRLACYG